MIYLITAKHEETVLTFSSLIPFEKEQIISLQIITLLKTAKNWTVLEVQEMSDYEFELYLGKSIERMQRYVIDRYVTNTTRTVLCALFRYGEVPPEQGI